MSVSDSVRTRVRQVAKDRCGYCRIQTHLVYAPMEIDHIFPKAHGGSDEEDNLWLACPFCNNAKSDKITSTDPITQENVRLFHPRQQVWSEHFAWDQTNRALILGSTPCGRATINALGVNEPIPLQFRRLVAEIGWYPPTDELPGLTRLP